MGGDPADLGILFRFELFFEFGGFLADRVFGAATLRGGHALQADCTLFDAGIVGGEGLADLRHVGGDHLVDQRSDRGVGRGVAEIRSEIGERTERREVLRSFHQRADFRLLDAGVDVIGIGAVFGGWDDFAVDFDAAGEDLVGFGLEGGENLPWLLSSFELPRCSVRNFSTARIRMPYSSALRKSGAGTSLAIRLKRDQVRLLALDFGRRPPWRSTRSSLMLLVTCHFDEIGGRILTQNRALQGACRPS